jgi:alpha-methylacyl-CoA racemase
MQPLQGIRVLDLSRLLPGPFASLILADLGAQVVKIEEPVGGDPMRWMPPLVGGQSAIFGALNRDKQSVCLDLKKPSGLRAMLQLVDRCDVVLEQFRPGVLDRLGLSHATMRARNPRLIVCALTGYGQDGPLAARAGHDINYLARSGVLGMHAAQSSAPSPPSPLPIQLADMGGGLWSALAIVAALHERDRTGQGSVLDVSMVEASMGFAFFCFGNLFAGQPAKGENEWLTGGLAIYRAYFSKDGETMTLGALEPKFWEAFCAGVGLEMDASALVLGPHQAILKDKLQHIFASRTRAEWELFAREHDCCLEPVMRLEELRGDEQLTVRGVFFEMESRGGKLLHMRTPLTARDAIHAPAPEPGEHTESVLREAGIDPAQITALRGEGAIR